MKRRNTRLQRRIAVALTLIVLLMVVVQGYLAYATLTQQEDDLVDQIVESEARRLLERLAQGDAPLATDGTPTDLSSRFRAWLLPASATGETPPAAGLSPQARELRSGTLILHEGPVVRHYLATPTQAGLLILEYDASEDEAFVYRFGAYLVVTGLVIVVLAGIVSLTIARIVVAPFRRLALQLSHWSPGGRPLPAGRSDEETLLLEAFDAAQRRLDDSHARAREFAANVRHEIRTPLTALRTDAEMLLMTQPLDEAGRMRLMRMQATVDSVSADIESMHNLSLALPAQAERVDLSVCLNNVWAGLQHHNLDGRLELVDELARGDVVDIDRLALMTVLRNLLRNAIEHAAPGRCTVRRIPDGLEVVDEGPGIDPEVLPQIFERHFSRHRADLRPGPQTATGASTLDDRTPHEGRGLGLAIAQHTARSRGWTLDVESGPGHGTVFTLRFHESSTQSRRNLDPT
ncbi:MAG: HAMP domain-containing histidine kinase [Gemmatimonadales bacterium]|nr:HAMP domain-containing histidine kinase [Gemmatimonadales bacterium]